MMQLIPRWLRDNFKVKFGMFLLATLLWFLVVTEKKYEYTVQLPLVPTNIMDGKMITSPYPRMALVKFQATGKELLRMLFINKPELHANLATIKEYYKYPIKLDMVVMQGGIIAEPLEIVFPDSVLFVLDNKLEQELPIVSRLTVQPAAGYTFSNPIEFDPQTVKMIGPERTLGSLLSVQTDTLRLSDLKRNTRVEVVLKPPREFGVTLEPERVTAVISIERLGERKMIGLPIEARNVPVDRAIMLEPGTIDVTISGGVSKLSDLEMSDIKVWVDYDSYQPRRSKKMSVMVDVDGNLEIIDFTPHEVRLIVRVK